MFSRCVPVILVRFLLKLCFSRQILENSLNIRFNGNPSSGKRVVPCGRTDGRTDMAELIVAFRNFANAPQKERKKERKKEQGRKVAEASEFKNYPHGRAKCNTTSVGALQHCLAPYQLRHYSCGKDKRGTGIRLPQHA